MSNAGSMLRGEKLRKYKYIALLGLFLFIITLMFALWIMYYTSPRFSNQKKFTLRFCNTSIVNINLSDVVSERLFYDVKIVSDKPCRLTLEFFHRSENIETLEFKEALEIRRKGSIVLALPPEKIYLVFYCSDCCNVFGSVTLRYSHIDYELLFFYNVTLILLAFISLGLFIYGIYSFMLLSYKFS